MLSLQKRKAMAQLVVGSQNTLAYTWNVTAGVGTLVITGETAWDLQLTDILRIFNTTHTGQFGISATTTFSNTFVSGLPTWTWVFTNLPAGTVSGDTLLIYLNVTLEQLNIALLQYQKA